MRGNWLTGSKPVQITAILSGGHVGIGSGDPYTVTDENPCLSPIRLTPVILTEWCGFEKEFDQFVKDEFYLQEKCNGNPGALSLFKVLICDRLILVEYLHQLQNWYSLFTGKELEIKIPQTI